VRTWVRRAEVDAGQRSGTSSERIGQSPLRVKECTIDHPARWSGGSPHHFRAMNNLRNVLAGFFPVQVLSPGRYLDHSSYADRSTLTDDDLAAAHGAALTAFARADRTSDVLSALRPQV